MKQVVPLSQFLKGGYCCLDGDFNANFPLSSVICSVFQFVCFVLFCFFYFSLTTLYPNTRGLTCVSSF